MRNNNDHKRNMYIIREECGYSYDFDPCVYICTYFIKKTVTKSTDLC